MRIIFLVSFVLTIMCTYAQNSPYDLESSTASGSPIKLSDFRGKKVCIVSIGRQLLESRSAFYLWDSLQKANPKVKFIIMPANDFGDDLSGTLSSNTMSLVPSNLVLLSPSLVKKDKGANQNSIMKWLTNKNMNLHFDGEVNSDLMIYIISESGELIGVLEKGVPISVVDEVLKQDDRRGKL